jgi:hypothetical protein
MRQVFKEIARFNGDYVLNAISWRMPGWLFVYNRAYLMFTDSPKFLFRESDNQFARHATLDDIPLLEKMGISGKLVKERIDNGDQCVILVKDNEILSIIWGSSGKRYLKISGTIFDPGKDGFIAYGAETVEKARLRGYIGVTYNLLNNYYLGHRRGKIYGSVHSLNAPSYRNHIKMNFSVIGETFHVSIFGIKFTYYRKWPHPSRKLHIFIKTPPYNLFWN